MEGIVYGFPKSVDFVDGIKKDSFRPEESHRERQFPVYRE